MSDDCPSFPSGIRDAVMQIWTVIDMSQFMMKRRKLYANMLICVWYACTQQYTRKKRIPMDISAMVDGWHRAIVALSTGHDKADVDHAEFAMEELMSPLLTAPVRQLRQFWTQLEVVLKADVRVPFFIWRMFETYGKVVVATATDQALIELKTTLAREVAELVEQEIQPDLMEALVGALRWRDRETLTQIRDSVKAGVKPKVVGKESCLFLQCGEHIVML